MPQLTDAKGMTLLEVAIALLLLAVGLLGLAGLQMLALRSDTLGHQATLATTLAKAKLTELQKTEELTAGADRYVDKVEGMTYDRQWSVQTAPAAAPQPEMATVRVQVSWRGALADRMVIVSAQALLAKPPETEATLTRGSLAKAPGAESEMAPLPEPAAASVWSRQAPET